MLAFQSDNKKITNYYFLFPDACCEFDEQTIFPNRHLSDYTPENVGLVFDWWPSDDLFQNMPFFFCNQRLKSILEYEDYHINGYSFNRIERISTDQNWIANYNEADPGIYYQLIINGIEGIDDVFIYNKKYLAVSVKLLKVLLQNHVTNARCKKIDTTYEIFFQEYEEHVKQNRYLWEPQKVQLEDLL